MCLTKTRNNKHTNTNTANLLFKTLDLRGFDSSRILILRGGILMSIGGYPEIMNQQILAGIILVGRLGILLVQRFGSGKIRKELLPWMYDRAPFKSWYSSFVKHWVNGSTCAISWLEQKHKNMKEALPRTNAVPLCNIQGSVAVGLA